MAITEIVDPRTKKKLLVAEGKVTGIYFNELKEPKELGSAGKSWVVTHSINVVVDGDKVSLGMTDKTELRCKDADGEWHDVVKGVEVSISVSEGEPYKGVKQYRAYSKDVLVLDASGAQAEKAPPAVGGAAKQPYAKKDMTGVSTGHAINIAFNLLAGEAVDNAEGVIELAKKAHDLTQALKTEYAAKNPDMSDYDLGAMVGQSVLSASNVTDFDSLEAVARDTLDKIVSEVSAYVKGGDAPKPAAKPAAKKAVAKKAVAAKPAKQEAPPPDDIPDPDDFMSEADDSDIPF